MSWPAGPTGLIGAGGGGVSAASGGPADPPVRGRGGYDPGMTPREWGRRLGGDTSMSDGGRWARPVVDVPADRWSAAAGIARDELGFDFFDWLSAVDERPDGYRIVAHLWSTTGRHGLLLRTLTGPDRPAVASVVDIWPGAAWHERETYEMFGVDFPGHPGGLAPLLLPPEFEGHPLRKDFVLAARVAKAWPGEKEPEDQTPTRAARRRPPPRPPGVPAPGEWGPGRE